VKACPGGSESSYYPIQVPLIPPGGHFGSLKTLGDLGRNSMIGPCITEEEGTHDRLDMSPTLFQARCRLLVLLTEHPSFSALLRFSLEGHKAMVIMG